MKTKTRKLVLSAMLAALGFVLTMVVQIPSPLHGYIHLGDAPVLLSGWLLSPAYGFLSAGLGAAMADLALGYTVYAPATFVIKGLMALCAHFVFRRLKARRHLAGWLSAVLAELTMVLGYYVFEGFLYGFIPSAVNIPPNAVQGAFGAVIGIILLNIFTKKKIL